MYSVTTGGGQTLPWMIPVHGMSQDHRYFNRQIAYFGRTHRILAVDLPGHGLASTVEGPFGHVEMARHVAAEIGRAGIRGAVYWGTHTGATIAPLVNRSCPGVLTSFILEGPAVPGENLRWLWTFSAARREPRETGAWRRQSRRGGPKAVGSRRCAGMPINTGRRNISK